MSLVTRLRYNLEGIVLLYKATLHGINSLEKNTEWYNSSDGRGENKFRMRELGSALFLSTSHLQESVILFLARAVEDIIFDLQKRIKEDINIWKLDSTKYMYLKEAQEVRHLSNVIRHNSGYILEGEGQSSDRLISNFGYHNHEKVGSIEFDFDLKLFQTYNFCVSLIGNIFNVNNLLIKDQKEFLTSLFPLYFSFLQKDRD